MNYARQYWKKKMNHKHITTLCILFILTAPAFALTVNQETTSVSRIVGETPEQMKRQFDVGTFTLDDAAYYKNKQNDEIEFVLDSQFPSVSTNQDRNWFFNDVEQQLESGSN